MGVSRVVVGRVARILLGIAIAQLILLSVGTCLELALGRRSIDAHGEGGLSLLQLGARAFRSDVWRGVTPKIILCLVPDAPLAGHADKKRTLRVFYHRLGLEPGKVWIPQRSFESRNAMWWLPAPIKRCPPREPIGKLRRL
jgi:hypothetical protein